MCGSTQPDEPLRIALAGHADCVGATFDNQVFSERRVQAVFEEVIRPALLESGFDQSIFDDDRRFKLVGFGETAPVNRNRPRCVETPEDRRVVVIVQ